MNFAEMPSLLSTAATTDQSAKVSPSTEQVQQQEKVDSGKTAGEKEEEERLTFTGKVHFGLTNPIFVIRKWTLQKCLFRLTERTIPRQVQNNSVICLFV